MTAFRPISPGAAIDILNAADIRVDRERLLVDLAMAGTVKGYARLIEIEAAGAAPVAIRDGRIDRATWWRIIAADRIADIYRVGSIHMDEQGPSGRLSVIGIRFDAASVTAAAADHSLIAPSPITPTSASTPRARMAAAVADVFEPVPIGVAEPSEASNNESRAILHADTVALSIDQAADVLGVARGTIHNLIKRDQLVARKVGRRTLVQADSVRALLT